MQDGESNRNNPRTKGKKRRREKAKLLNIELIFLKWDASTHQFSCKLKRNKNKLIIPMLCSADLAKN